MSGKTKRNPKETEKSSSAFWVGFIVVTLGIGYGALMKLLWLDSTPVAGTMMNVVAPVMVVDHRNERIEPLPAGSRARGEQRRAGKAEVTDDDAAMLTWPIRATRLSSGFGHRINPVTGDEHVHRGVDVPAPCGTEVVAVEEGEVVFAGWTDSAGNTIKVAHPGGWFTVYMHLARTGVTPGMRVAAGDLIGLSGDTGRLTTGPHLHFEIHRGTSAINPLAFRFQAPTAIPQLDIPAKGFCGRAPRYAEAPRARNQDVAAADPILASLFRESGLRTR